MSTVVIVGCGNIGYRHLQAAASVEEGVKRIVVVEPRAERREAIASEPLRPATGTELGFFEALEPVTREVEGAALVVLAVTADRQPAIAARVAELRPKAVLLEKPIAQSRMQLDAVCAAFSQHPPPSGVYVDCARPLFAGWAHVRGIVRRSDRAVELRAEGSGWGFGCNAVHFLEVFRFVTGARSLACTDARLAPVDGGSKRGPAYEEYAGSATFTAPSGDRLVVECTEGAPSAVTLSLRDRDSGELLIVIDEGSGTVRSVESGEERALGALPVSRSTAVVIERLLLGHEVGLPSLTEAAGSHEALFQALARATGVAVFPIT